MEYAVVLGALALVIAVKAFTAMALNKEEITQRRLTGDDRELGSKIAALSATERQLLRENKSAEEQLHQVENEKDEFLVAIQKFGATPVDEPTEEAVFGFQKQSAAGTPVTVSANENRVTELDEESEEPPDEQNAENVGAGDAASDEGSLPLASAGVTPAGFQGEVDAGSSGTAEAEEDSRSRVLIVDDNSELRDLLTEALGETYAIDSAPDGLEALHRLMKQGCRYDVVMTDLNMPHIDGIAFLDRLPEGIPAIVMSAYLDRPEFAQALTHPRATRVLEKPFRLSDVRAAIESAVGPKGTEGKGEIETEAETPTAS